MRRTAALACLAAAMALLPLQAEAARFRLGGRSGATKVGRGIVVIPGAAAATGPRTAAAEEAGRVPFPPASARPGEPAPLRLSTNEGDKRPWCPTQAVIGGFCMMN